MSSYVMNLGADECANYFNAGYAFLRAESVLARTVRSNARHHATRRLLKRGDEFVDIFFSGSMVEDRCANHGLAVKSRGRGRGNAPILQIDGDLSRQMVRT